MYILYVCFYIILLTYNNIVSTLIDLQFKIYHETDVNLRRFLNYGYLFIFL